MSAQSVSVVVPLYNKAPYIQRCLRSIQQQTYRQFDIVVVNDGSSDGGERLVEALGDSRIRLIHQANAGVSAARNKGVEAATGEWIFFLDADDEWAPRLVESLVGLMDRCCEAGVVACPTERINADGSSSCVRLKAVDFAGESEYLKDYFATFVRLGQSPFSSSSFAVRRKTFVAVGGYKPRVRLTEDSDLWVRLALTTPMAMIRTALARYYVEIEGNTRTLGQSEKFHVTSTLEHALANNMVPLELRSSAKGLVRLQKLTQIRRNILLGQAGLARHGLGDLDLWKGVPVASLVALVACLVPAAWVKRGQWLKKLMR